MSRYAARTKVPVSNSRREIERTLQRYKAIEFAYAETGEKAMVGFRCKERRVRFVLPLPKSEQGVRSAWRALALSIKAKLEVVESGITTFEEEFFAHLVIPGGKTIAEAKLGEYVKAIEGSKELPPLLGM